MLLEIDIFTCAEGSSSTCRRDNLKMSGGGGEKEKVGDQDMFKWRIF